MIKEIANKPFKEFVACNGKELASSFKEVWVDGAKWLAITIVDNSFWICLTVAMVGLIFYMGGNKKGAKAVTISIIVFVVLQAIGVVIR